MRHAEKAAPRGDLPLNDAGAARAVELARVVGDLDVGALFATQYRRTQDTLAPLAERSGVEVTVARVESVEGSARELAERILSEHRGKVAVVAGHSNTVPAIIAALGGDPPASIDDDRYDVRLLQQHAGLGGLGERDPLDMLGRDRELLEQPQEHRREARVAHDHHDRAVLGVAGEGLRKLGVQGHAVDRQLGPFHGSHDLVPMAIGGHHTHHVGDVAPSGSGQFGQQHRVHAPAATNASQ